jgi:acyl-CoA thioesterase I
MDARSDKARQDSTLRFGCRRTVWLAVFAVVATSVLPDGGGAVSRCKAPQELVRFKAPLGRLAHVAARQDEINIVALGSSSTAGAGARDPRACYPARLEVELNNRYPGKRFRVTNLGVAGHLATDMLARVETEVLPLNPALVIWQTGVNDVINNVGVDSFRSTLQRGVDELTGRGIDVILLDMQFYPRSEHLPGYRDYLSAMWEVGREKNVPVLQRFQIMKYWVTSLQFSADQLLAPDHFRPNDLTYGCLADLLADSIQAGLGRSLAPGASSATRP